MLRAERDRIQAKVDTLQTALAVQSSGCSPGSGGSPDSNHPGTPKRRVPIPKSSRAATIR